MLLAFASLVSGLGSRVYGGWSFGSVVLVLFYVKHGGSGWRISTLPVHWYGCDMAATC